jgi:hypothetical protein
MKRARGAGSRMELINKLIDHVAESIELMDHSAAKPDEKDEIYQLFATLLDRLEDELYDISIDPEFS